MSDRKTAFALYFGTRVFFPASLIKGAREEMPRMLAQWGYGSMMLDENATRFGAVETSREGAVYANWLRENKGKFDGVILCLPNFGDETGAVAALQEAGVPILVQAYPDDLDKMSPELRRDAFCGKLSIMDVFCQYNVPFTALKPHVVSPSSPKFKENVDQFAATCRVVNGVKGMVVGMIGARTTPFKTVRIDELALQRHGITVETVDMASVIMRTVSLAASDKAVVAKQEFLRDFTNWTGVPDVAFENLSKLAVVLDQIVEEMQLDAIAIRCWTELQEQLGVSPCVVLGAMNQVGIAAACEVDVGNAIIMHAFQKATNHPAALLDWNNNYGDDEDKCILFHCGPVPASLMDGKGLVTDHAILKNALAGCGTFGCNTGRITPMPFTFGSLLTSAGKVKAFVGTGDFTDDAIPQNFFGCAGVAKIKGLQDVLLHMGEEGHRHHVTVAPGYAAAAVKEAFEKYLGFEVTMPQK